MLFRVEIRIVPRAGILDPQGKAVEGALAGLGFTGVAEVHVGRFVALDLEAASTGDAEQTANAMCRQLLANPVTEDFVVQVRETAGR